MIVRSNYKKVGRRGAPSGIASMCTHPEGCGIHPLQHRHGTCMQQVQRVCVASRIAMAWNLRPTVAAYSCADPNCSSKPRP